MISRKLQLKRKAEVCDLGFYSENHLTVTNKEKKPNNILSYSVL